ncbi:helix-turn-helix transcriptional regulator [Nocardioides dongkuii]|uniref:helix-turn-helix transcriptional regulator n=1 Tax=Nocardioides dongkuii TaxID=2760089 RepID=UPI0015FCD841|nr:response regulator transcription factor [Nocardioides dongkuii]
MSHATCLATYRTGGEATVPIRVALSNDYDIVKCGLEAMLRDHADRVQVLDDQEARVVPPDILLVDTFGRLTPNDDMLRRLAQDTDAKVVVYGWHPPESVAHDYGVAGVVPRDVTGTELADALVTIHEAEDASGAAGGRRARWRGAGHGLSAREAEVLTLIVRGLSNQEIAERCLLSANTVKAYIRTCYRKIRAEGRSQAVAWGVRHGFAAEDALTPSGSGRA